MKTMCVILREGSVTRLELRGPSDERESVRGIRLTCPAHGTEVVYTPDHDEVDAALLLEPLLVTGCGTCHGDITSKTFGYGKENG